MASDNDSVDTDKQLGEVRHSVDVEKLSEYLLRQRPQLFAAPLKLKQFGYGQSNPSYQITDANGRKYVLRKQPPGALLAKSAHRVDREFAMLKALASTDVPVPKVHILCQEKDVIGTDFYIMEFLQGRIFHSPGFPGVDDKQRKALWESAVTTLAALHAIDPRQLDLPESWTSKMSSHYPRQLVTLSKVAAAQADTEDPKTKEKLGPIDDIDEIVGWMKKHMPKERIGIVHGDYKIDNLVYHPTEPQVIGILDWELCTIGHPLADLGNLLQPWSVPDMGGQSSSAFRLDRSLPGLPTVPEILALYAEKSGYDPRRDWRFAVVYAHFRLAVIIHGIAARVQRGQASSAQATALAPMHAAFAYFATDAMSQPEAKL